VSAETSPVPTSLPIVFPSLMFLRLSLFRIIYHLTNPFINRFFGAFIYFWKNNFDEFSPNNFDFLIANFSASRVIRTGGDKHRGLYHNQRTKRINAKCGKIEGKIFTPEFVEILY